MPGAEAFWTILAISFCSFDVVAPSTVEAICLGSVSAGCPQITAFVCVVGLPDLVGVHAPGVDSRTSLVCSRDWLVRSHSCCNRTLVRRDCKRPYFALAARNAAWVLPFGVSVGLFSLIMPEPAWAQSPYRLATTRPSSAPASTRPAPSQTMGAGAHRRAGCR